MFQFVFAAEEFHIEGLGEILAEEVRSTCLQGLTVLHEGFNAIGVHRAGEAFVGCFHPFDDREGHPVLDEIGVDIQHLTGFLHGFFSGGMGGVAFLPEEFGGAEEETRAHFPADDVGPLVDEQREIPV